MKSKVEASTEKRNANQVEPHGWLMSINYQKDLFIAEMHFGEKRVFNSDCYRQ